MRLFVHLLELIHFLYESFRIHTKHRYKNSYADGSH